MIGATQQQQNARILNGAVKTAPLSMVGIVLTAVVVPTGSTLGGKTMSFSNVINGVEYPVRNADGTAYSITLAAGMCNIVDERIAVALTEFVINVNLAPSADSDIILVGYQG